MEELLFGGAQLAVAGHGPHEGLHDAGVQHGSTRRHPPHGARELVALRHPVLEQVGVAGRALAEQRHRVLGVVVLREHHDPGAGVPLAQLLGGVDALALERRRHADVGHQHLRRQARRLGDQLVVVASDPDDLEVRLEGEDRPHALPDDRVVVSEEHRDRAACHAPIGPRIGATGKGAGLLRSGMAPPPSTPGAHPWAAPAPGVGCPDARHVLRRSGLHPGARARLRADRRPHVVRGRCDRRRCPAPAPRRRDRHPPRHRAPRRGPVPGNDPAHAPPLGPRAGPPVLHGRRS